MASSSRQAAHKAQEAWTSAFDDETNSPDEDDEDFKPVLPSSRKKARKAGRGAVACLQCRARKLACDLASPACGSCVKKGEGHACSIGNLLWYDNPEDAPAAKLKASVDRLEEMVHKIRATSSAPSTEPASPSGARTPSSKPSPLTPHGSSAMSQAASDRSSSKPAPTRRRAADLLSKLLLTRTVDPGARVGSGVDMLAIASALQYAPTLQLPPLPDLAEPSSRYSRPAPEAFNSVLSIMPTPSQAITSLAAFFATPFPIPILHHGRFMAQCQNFWDTGSALDPHWLATYLAANGLGLLRMSEEDAMRQAMPTGEGKALLARSWLDGALQALFSGEFLTTPSLESVRAVVLLNHFWSSWHAGVHLQASVSFNTSVIASAFEIELHLDPDELDRNFFPLEAEERRRIFWALFSHDTIARTFLGKTYAPLPIASVTARAPTLLDDAFEASGALVNPLATFTAAASLRATVVLLAQPQSGIPRSLPLVEESAGMGFQALRELAMVRARIGTSNEAREHCFRLLEMLESVQTSSSASETLFVALASCSAAITLAVESFESSRLSNFMSQLDSPRWPLELQPVLQRCSIILRHVVPPPPPPMPPSLFLGGGQSPASSSTESFVDTPPQAFFMPPNYEPVNRRTSDPASLDAYRSPFPSDQSLATFTFDFDVPSYYADAPLFGTRPAKSGIVFGTNENDSPCPLLKPWLSTQHEWGFASPPLPLMQDIY